MLTTKSVPARHALVALLKTSYYLLLITNYFFTKSTGVPEYDRCAG